MTANRSYYDHRPTLQQQREHRRQMRRLFAMLVPLMIVAAGFLVWRVLS